MASADKYGGYSAIQLATDANFISWVKCPDEANELFWKEYIDKYPSQFATVDKARIIVNEMHIVEHVMVEDRVEETWKKISERIERLPLGKIRSFNMHRWMAAAAAIIILLAGAGYFLLFNKPYDKIAKAENSSLQTNKKDIPPGGNKAILTLANGATIILDSAKNGALTKQGNIKVIKLNDGQLAYESAKSSEQIEVQYNTISTPRGGQYQLILEDGSKVWLNAASSLRYPASFTGNERKVELTGEAYFEVKHNAAMPFKVNVAGREEVEVLGTHFNINSYEDEPVIKTTLLEGRVKVSNNISSLVITPGEQSIVSDNGKIEAKQNVDEDEVMAWKNGQFIFNSLDIQTIMRQISRWYDVDVSFEGNLSKEPFSGIVSRNGNVSQVLKIMEHGGVKFSVEGKRIIVRQ